MTSKLNNEFYFVSPLEVVKVTSENLEEAAAWCGGKVAQVESRKVKGRLDSYVWVPTPKGTQISWAFPGMFITRRIIVTLKNELAYSFQVYRRDYFEKNYFGTPNEAVDNTWERAAKARKKTKKVAQKAPEPGTVERQAVEASTEESDAPSADLVQQNRDKNQIRPTEEVQLPAAPVDAGVPVAPGIIKDETDEVTVEEAVELLEKKLGAEVISTGPQTDEETDTVSSEIPVEDLRVK